MTKQEANDIFDSKGEEVFDELLDYIFIEKDYAKATKFIVEVVGCDETIAKAMVLETIPTNTENQSSATINIPKCPICQSTDLSKISTTKKVAKIAAFGIFGMGDNGKTWKCNNCGSKF